MCSNLKKFLMIISISSFVSCVNAMDCDSQEDECHANVVCNDEDSVDGLLSLFENMTFEGSTGGDYFYNLKNVTQYIQMVLKKYGYKLGVQQRICFLMLENNLEANGGIAIGFVNNLPMHFFTSLGCICLSPEKANKFNFGYSTQCFNEIGLRLVLKEVGRISIDTENFEIIYGIGTNSDGVVLPEARFCKNT